MSSPADAVLLLLHPFRLIYVFTVFYILNYITQIIKNQQTFDLKKLYFTKYFNKSLQNAMILYLIQYSRQDMREEEGDYYDGR